MEEKIEAIARELALFQKNELERNNSLKTQLGILDTLFKTLDTRVKTLEEARQKQIQINTQLLKAQETLKIGVKRSFWDFILKK